MDCSMSSRSERGSEMRSAQQRRLATNRRQGTNHHCFTASAGSSAGLTSPQFKKSIYRSFVVFPVWTFPQPSVPILIRANQTESETH